MRGHSLGQAILLLSPSATLIVQFHIESSVGQHVLKDSTLLDVLGCVVELLDEDPMVHCVVSCRQVYKSCTGNHASLVTIFDMLSEVKQLTGA